MDISFSEKDTDIILIAFIYHFFNYTHKLAHGRNSRQLINDIADLDVAGTRLTIHEAESIAADTDIASQVIQHIKNHPLRLAFLDTRDDILIRQVVTKTADYVANQAFVAITENWNFYAGFEGPFDFALARTPFICSLFGAMPGESWPFSFPDDISGILTSKKVEEIIFSRLAIS